MHDFVGQIYKAVSDERLTCPISGCEKRFIFENLTNHLKNTHTPQQREAHVSEIQACGISWQDCHFLCPVCATRVSVTKTSYGSKIGDLRKHIAAEHLLLASTCLEPFSQVKFRPTGLLRCESCRLESGSDVRAIRAHMREHIRDPQEIFAFREQIFKVWPAFAHHSVFDDLCPAEWFTATNFKDWRVYYK